MAESGGQKGNKNARKGTEWRHAIRKALAYHANEHEGKPSAKLGLAIVARKFVEAAANGDAWAMKELGDRIDGKPGQSMELSGPDGGDIPMSGRVVFVDSRKPDES